MIKNRELLLSWSLWIIAVSLLAGALYFTWHEFKPVQHLSETPPQIKPATNQSQDPAAIRVPDFVLDNNQTSIHRAALVDTTIPDRENSEAITYKVEFNDSVFGIAARYDLEPETILWSNYNVLQDNPHSMTPGMDLVIPPIDGILYEWQVGDEIETVAAEFKTDPDLIINWTGNNLDLVNPEFEPGSLVMIPNGQRKLQQWIIPTISRGVAGVSAGVYGEGACSGPFDGLYGGGGFIWPVAGHFISGNDYWSGHLAC